MTSEIKAILNGNYEHHIMPLFWQKGEDKATLEEYMQRIYDCDIREVVLESRPFPDFCKDAWWEALANIIAIAKKLGMKLWIFDDSHFPTGYANGAMKEHLENKKILIKQRTIDAIGPLKSAKFYAYNMNLYHDETECFKSETLQDELLGIVAVNGEQRINLTNHVHGNFLSFDVPEGQWKITFIYIDSNNEFRPDYINMVDKASCDVLIQHVYEPHYEKFGDEFGKTIIGFFTDEPGFANEKGNKNDSLIGKDMPLPWSDEVAQRMAEGTEDFILDLPSLWLSYKDAPQIRHKYMDIVSKLYQECFDENIGNWCRSHGVKHIGHIIEDRDAHARLGIGAGHFFRAMAGQNMAGIDIVINQLVPGLDEGTHFYGRGYWDMEFFNYVLVKYGTSLAHIDPIKKQNTMAEVFGAFGWSEGLKTMKWISDHFLVRGTNYFVPHAFSQAEFPDPDCPPHFYAHGKNPQYRYFHKLMEYLNKMSTLISKGHTKPSVAMLYHADAEWSGEFMLNQKPAKELTQHQIDFDIIPTDVFEQRERYLTDTSNGLAINGTAYQCFVIPYCEYIGKAVVDFIMEAEKHQFPVYMLEALPKAMYDCELPLPNMSHVKVIPLHTLASNLKTEGYVDITTSEEQKYLRFLHYVKDNGNYYVFTNEDVKHTITTSITSNENMQYRYDVLNDKVYPFNGVLTLAPYESCVIINLPLTNVEITPIPEFKNKLVINEPCLVEYMSASSYPEVLQKKTIEAFENLDDIFGPQCGTYRYSWECVMDIDVKHATLDLGDVYEIAQVLVNGVDMGTRFAYPYSFDLTNLQEGKNKIVIEVTNKVDKEIHDMLSWHEVIEPTGILGPIVLRY